MKAVRTYIFAVIFTLGALYVAEARATPPQNPDDKYYNVEPADLAEIRKELTALLESAGETIKNAPATVTAGEFTKQYMAVAHLIRYSKAWTSGEIRVMVLTGKVDAEWEEKAWKPLVAAVVLCAKGDEWLYSHSEEAQKLGNQRDREYAASILKEDKEFGIKAFAGGRRTTNEAVALVAKQAGRFDLVENFFEKIGGKIEKYRRESVIGEYRSVTEEREFSSAKEFWEFKHELRRWANVPVAPPVMPVVKKVAEADQQILKKAIVDFYNAVNAKDVDAIGKLLADPDELELVKKALLEESAAKVDMSKAEFRFQWGDSGQILVDVEKMTITSEVNGKAKTEEAQKIFVAEIKENKVRLRLGGPHTLTANERAEMVKTANAELKRRNISSDGREVVVMLEANVVTVTFPPPSGSRGGDFIIKLDRKTAEVLDVKIWR